MGASVSWRRPFFVLVALSDLSISIITRRLRQFSPFSALDARRALSLALPPSLLSLTPYISTSRRPQLQWPTARAARDASSSMASHDATIRRMQQPYDKEAIPMMGSRAACPWATSCRPLARLLFANTDVRSTRRLAPGARAA